jgi:hypothetical protein
MLRHLDCALEAADGRMVLIVACGSADLQSTVVSIGEIGRAQSRKSRGEGHLHSIMPTHTLGLEPESSRGAAS